uniref:Proline-rich protein 7 n=1 Tax=Geotrypetes seraphini TaxID=260995 RepID=A0A6P8Q700_GEOSA|nr:proline-rich protein 7 [Geotrypetes seraphini]XP_033782813.1 proline-rich protein 7 [Geotrypetes seraphini]
MVMSPGTYTFLTCFAGFWLIWGFIVLLCCICSFIRRRVKRRQEERLREQTLRTVELEALQYEEYLNSPRAAVAHRLRSQLLPPPPVLHVQPWPYRQDTDFSKPPCYEEAVLMAEPPPPYSEVLTDTRGIYRKIGVPFPTPAEAMKQEHLPSHKQQCLGRAYSSALHLPQLACNELSQSNLLLAAECSGSILPSWTDSGINSSRLYRLQRTCHMPLPIPLFGRTTAV